MTYLVIFIINAFILYIFSYLNLQIIVYQQDPIGNKLLNWLLWVILGYATRTIYMFI